MANYCTATQVREHLRKLTTTNISDTEVDKFIVDVDAYINAFLAGLYTVPFTTVPPMITNISKILSAYKVGRSAYTRDSQSKSDWVDTFKEDGMELLKQIRGYNDKDGNWMQIPLVSSTGSVIAKKADAIKMNRSSYTPVFDMDDIENQSVDGDLSDAIADTRD